MSPSLCPVCRKPLTGRQRIACSGACRARRWREDSRRREEVLLARNREIRELLEAALRRLVEGSP